MKRFLVLMLVLTLLASLFVGCGKSSTKDETTTDEASEEKTQEKEEEPANLKYFGWTHAHDIREDTDKMFMEENPYIEIESELVPNDQYMTVLKTKIVSGEAPDVFEMLVGTNLEQYAEAGYVADLTDEPYLKDFGKSALDLASYKGKVYGIPLKINAAGVFYNKKMFADLGLSVPENWEEFINVCEVLKENDITPIAQGFKTEWTTQLMPYEILAQTVYYDNPDFNQDLLDGKAKFNGPEGWNDAINKYSELKKYFNNDFLSTDYMQTAALLTNRKAAMWPMATWGLPLVKKGENPEDFSYFPFKMKKENTNKSFGMVAEALSMSTSSEYPEAARKYMEFWATDKILEMFIGSDAIPTKNTIKADYDPIIKDYIEKLDLDTDIVSMERGWPLGIQPIIIKGYGEIFAAGRPVSEVLEDADKEMERWKKEQASK